jgi:hypothetical protein
MRLGFCCVQYFYSTIVDIYFLTYNKIIWLIYLISLFIYQLNFVKNTEDGKTRIITGRQPDDHQSGD